MFLDQMIRPKQVESFSSILQPHQLAKLPPVQAVVTLEGDQDEESSSEGKKGPETVLDRAMMEHNVLSCSKVYNNITFKGLGLLLGLKPSAAEQMARTMIQQKRLVGSIDQIEKLIIFDQQEKQGGDGIVSNVAQQLGGASGGGQQDEDDEVGKKEEASFAPSTKRWDLQIRQTLQLAESVAARCELLLAQGINDNNGGTVTVEASA